jgi:hypothetical protein
VSTENKRSAAEARPTRFGITGVVANRGRGHGKHGVVFILISKVDIPRLVLASRLVAPKGEVGGREIDDDGRD